MHVGLSSKEQKSFVTNEVKETTFLPEPAKGDCQASWQASWQAWGLGWSLQGKTALYFMDIKSCVSFTELRTLVLYLGVFVIGKNTPQSKISRVKWWNNITLFNFSHFFLFFSIHLHNLPNYTIFSYPDSKFLSGNMCTEYQFRGKNDWIWVYPPIV